MQDKYVNFILQDKIFEANSLSDNLLPAAIVDALGIIYVSYIILSLSKLSSDLSTMEPDVIMMPSVYEKTYMMDVSKAFDVISSKTNFNHYHVNCIYCFSHDADCKFIIFQ